jgi:hypothetical protein
MVPGGRKLGCGGCRSGSDVFGHDYGTGIGRRLRDQVLILVCVQNTKIYDIERKIGVEDGRSAHDLVVVTEPLTPKSA